MLVLSCVVFLSGCAGMAKFMDGLTPQPITMQEVDDAREKKDAATLKQLCLEQKRKSSVAIADASCAGAVEVLAEQGNEAELDAICEGKGEYTRWRYNRKACQAKEALGAHAKVKVLAGATCENVISLWETHKKEVTAHFGTTKAARDAVFQSTALRMIECGSWDYVWEKMVHWGNSNKGLGAELLRVLDTKGYDLETEMLAYLKRSASV